jgi:hypothetical protein
MDITMDYEDFINPKTEKQTPNFLKKASTRGIFLGAVFIILGLFIYLLQTDVFILRNWWVIFIGGPGVYLIYVSYTTYQVLDRLTFKSILTFIIGSVLVSISILLLFELKWKTFWPIFLISPAIGMILLAAILGKSYRKQKRFQYAKVWFYFIGLNFSIMGLLIIVEQLGWVPFTEYLHNWWGYFFLITSLAGIFNFISIRKKSDTLVNNKQLLQLNWSYAFASAGVIIITGIPLRFIPSIVLVGVGVIIIVGNLIKKRKVFIRFFKGHNPLA